MGGLDQLTAVILAGGLGTRFRSVTQDRPKVLAEIRGRPFTTYLLDQLIDAGLVHVVLCTGYLGEQVWEMIGETYGPLGLEYSHESTPRGTGGALRLALPLIKSEIAVVMNGDSFCEIDLKAVLSWHLEKKAETTLLLSEVDDTTRYGLVDVDSGGRVTGFSEKGENTGPGWINAGIYVFQRHILLDIPEGRAVSLEREIFPGLIGKGLHGYCHRGRFLDIGTPESYALAGDFFK